MWSSYPLPFFFLFDIKGVGTRPRKEWVCSLTLTLKHQDGSKGLRAHSFLLTFFFLCHVPPPRGREDSKRSTGHELIEHSTIQSASRVTLAPQTTKRQEKLVGEGSEKASENGRPVWSAVHVVQVRIGSNLQRGRFRPCVSGLLAKHLDGCGSRPGAWNPICTARSSGAGRALLCLERHLGREENTSSVVPVPSGQ